MKVCAYGILLISVLLTGCTTVSLSINPKQVYWGADSVALSGGSPAGGYYTGYGIEDSVLYPQKTKASGDSSSYKIKVTYHYGWFMKSAEDYITVRGYIPDEGDVCKKCNGKRKILCSICHGRKDEIKRTPCKKCHGKGYRKIRCKKCEGEGKVRNFWSLGFTRKDCSECRSAGSIKEMCSACKGKKSFPCCPDGKGYIPCNGPCSINHE